MSDVLSSAHGVTLDPAASGPHAHKSMSFLAMDPPRHGRMRALVSRGFTPRRVADLEPRIRKLTVSTCLRRVESGSFDMISDLAGLLPMDVISELVGVPPDDRAELRRMADLLVHRPEGVHDVPPEGVEAALTLVGYYADMIAQRRAKRTDDLDLGAASMRESDGDRLTDDDIIVVSLPHGGRRKRDHDQASGQRLVLGLAQPRRSIDASSTNRRSCPSGSRRRCATTPRRRCWPGSRPANSRSRRRHSCRGAGACFCSGPRTGIRRLRRPRRLPHRPRRRGQSGELRIRTPLLSRRVAGTARGADRARGIWSRPLPATTSISTAPNGSTPSMCGDSVDCLRRWFRDERGIPMTETPCSCPVASGPEGHLDELRSDPIATDDPGASRVRRRRGISPRRPDHRARQWGRRQRDVLPGIRRGARSGGGLSVHDPDLRRRGGLRRQPRASSRDAPQPVAA